MDTVLGAGSTEPGVHVTLNVVPTRGAYLAGVDTPSYQTGGAARCPYQTGAAAPAGSPAAVAPPPSSIVATQLTDAMGLGDVNSPAENQLIGELMGPTHGVAPDEYPDWASLLVGPTLRGTVVTLQ